MEGLPFGLHALFSVLQGAQVPLPQSVACEARHALSGPSGRTCALRTRTARPCAALLAVEGLALRACTVSLVSLAVEGLALWACTVISKTHWQSFSVLLCVSLCEPL